MFAYVQIHQIIHNKYVQFFIYQLYHNKTIFFKVSEARNETMVIEKNESIANLDSVGRGKVKEDEGQIDHKKIVPVFQPSLDSCHCSITFQ